MSMKKIMFLFMCITVACSTEGALPKTPILLIKHMGITNHNVLYATFDKGVESPLGVCQDFLNSYIKDFNQDYKDKMGLPGEDNFFCTFYDKSLGL
jgi:hypothetical protein